MSYFPKTLEELQRDNYRFLESGTCRGCGRVVGWWRTPAGKRMPIDPPGPDGTLETHFATCPKSAQFSKKAKKAMVER
jgi:hypothetical protein